MEFHSHNEAETEAIGARLAAVLNPGAVVAYLGDLGMGKTAFTRDVTDINAVNDVVEHIYQLGNDGWDSQFK